MSDGKSVDKMGTKSSVPWLLGHCGGGVPGVDGWRTLQNPSPCLRSGPEQRQGTTNLGSAPSRFNASNSPHELSSFGVGEMGTLPIGEARTPLA